MGFECDGRAGLGAGVHCKAGHPAPPWPSQAPGTAWPPQTVGRYQFTHALIQETLSEELTLTRRVRLHARIAETLEELYGDSADVHAAELAHQFA